MKAVRVVRYSEVPSTPWKNGHGYTRQLAIHPPQAGPDDFEWRVSIAQLDRSAPFSVFPGIERCLAVLAGEMILEREWCDPMTLTPDSRAATFSGAAPSNGLVVRGPVLDLNLMYRATRWHASLRRHTGAANASLALQFAAERTLVCSMTAELHLELAGQRFELGLYDLLVGSGDWQDQVLAAHGYDLYSIQLLRL